jgi:hypothetical protein
MQRTSKLDHFIEDINDDYIHELQQRIISKSNFHVPKPGDDDYLTPEQVSEIKKGLKNYV